jgi:hypothetical protein
MRRLYLTENAWVLKRDFRAFCVRSEVRDAIPEGCGAAEVETGLGASSTPQDGTLVSFCKQLLMGYSKEPCSNGAPETAECGHLQC